MIQILDEFVYAENLIQSTSSKFPSYPDLKILAKYFRFIGTDENELLDKLLEFCKNYDLNLNENIFYNKIENAIKNTKNSILRIPSDVPITSNELSIIRSLNNYRYEKVLFVLLFLGKYYKITNTKINHKNSSRYYTNLNYSAIMRMAHTNEREEENIFNYFKTLGLLIYVQKYNSLALNFIDSKDNSNVEIIVNNIDNIIDFYPQTCQICHNIISKKSNRQLMCNNCWNEKHRKLERIRIKNKRMKNVGG